MTSVPHSGAKSVTPGGSVAGGAGHTPVVGPIWSCKIGVTGALALPAGCDGPMRRAVDDAFQRLTGRQSEFIFSGWSATLTEPELAAVENRWPSEEHYAAERVRDAAPELLAFASALDADWTREFPEGPDTVGVGFRLADETVALWRQARAAIAKATAGETRNAEPIHRRDGDEG